MTTSVSEWIKNGEIPKARLMFLRLARPDVFESEKAAPTHREAEPQSACAPSDSPAVTSS